VARADDLTWSLDCGPSRRRRHHARQPGGGMVMLMSGALVLLGLGLPVDV
jgi:hypothetical protein